MAAATTTSTSYGSSAFGSDPNNRVNQQSQQVAPQYPQMPAVSPTEPLLSSIGATGTAIFSGIITSEEYNPDWYWRDGVKILEQMTRNDAQINATRSMLELPIRRATWSIQPGSASPRDQEIASFVQSCLFDDMHYTTASGRVLHQKWDDILRHVLMHLTYGFMAFEINWRVDDGWVKWGRWTPLLPRTVWRWWVGPDNELAGIQQWTFKNYAYGFVDIPADKLLLFSHRQEGNNYEGVSIFRSAYKHWWYKENFEKIDAIGIERNAVTPPVITLGPEASASDRDAALQIVANVRANETLGVVIPHSMTFEYPKNNQRYAAQTLPAIQYHDIMIARNVLCQFLNLGSTETGAYSLDRSQVNTFLSSLQAVCEYIEDVINNDAIQKLVDYNFDGVEVYPKLKCSKLTAQNTEALAESLSKLVSGQTPLISPDPLISGYLLDQFGVPHSPTDQVQSTNPSAPSTPDRPQNQRSGDHSDEESKNVTPVNQSGSGRATSNAATTASADAADGASASEVTDMADEARLLREALDAAYGIDVVERGMVFYNPYPRQKGGRFGPGPGKAGGAGSSGAKKGKGAGTTKSGGSKTEGEGKGTKGAARGGGGGGGGSAGGGGGGAGKSKAKTYEQWVKELDHVTQPGNINYAEAERLLKGWRGYANRLRAEREGQGPRAVKQPSLKGKAEGSSGTYEKWKAEYEKAGEALGKSTVGGTMHNALDRRLALESNKRFLARYYREQKGEGKGTSRSAAAKKTTKAARGAKGGIA